MVVALLCAAGVVDSPTGASVRTEAPKTAPEYDFRAERLAQSYDRWRSGRLRAAGDYELVVALSWFKGVSAERSQAKGLASINLDRGLVSVELGGVDLESLGDVWLIDNRPGDGASAMPGVTDAMRRVGSLQIDDGYGTLPGDLGPTMFREFDVDQVVVTRRGESPVEGGVLYGSLPLFERLHRVSWRIEQGLAPIAGDESSRLGLLAEFPPSMAAASPKALGALGLLVDEGEDLFENETFNGNGRTCATCHPQQNNLTLDKEFIATLPPDDPLFVAEFVPELNHELNGGLFFENPVLMREFGLIVENPDGFEDLAQKFVMRSPSHVFAQALSLEPAESDCATIPPLHRVGWGGDGAAGSGTLREFAIGAVIQHAPLTLGRVDGVDFRLPTDEELDAMEAFQLSLGRQEELDLETMDFTDANVAAGRDLFILEDGGEGGGGKCHLCHGNGGALRAPGQLLSSEKNHNFDIGIFLLDHPAEPLGEPMPFDDGFGIDVTGQARCINTFNTPSIIEAADTAPFSHNNVFATLEEVVAHYGTDVFNNQSVAGQALQCPGNCQTTFPPIVLSDQEVELIGALLRVLNALQNIDDVANCDARVLAATSPAESRRLLRICLADNRDAIDVLSSGPLAPLHPTAQSRLRGSLNFHRQAFQATTVAERNAALNAAAPELAAARADMLNEVP